jgi:Ca2+-binding RTX toxin-like protein
MARSLLLAVVAALALCAPLGSQAHSTSVGRWNGRIAFSDVTGIGSMNPNGSGQWGVELNLGDTQPAWSPAGTQLAVSTHWAGQYGILVMQPDGSGAHLLTTNPADSGPAWSPDGTRLAFTDGANLLVVDADGGNRRVLYSAIDGWIGRPAWSPDGSWLAFSTGAALGEVEVATGKEHTLLDGVPYPQNPAFSPDGTQLAFSSGGAIWLAGADGTNPQPLAPGTQWSDQPAWSPNGAQIAFVGDNQIWVMNRDGSSAYRLTSGDGNSWPAWQPLGPPPSNCTLWGTSANDLLVGTEGNDIICGLGGDDTLYGLGGNDILRGDDGTDRLAGGTGLDFLDAGPGDDTLDGRDGGGLDHLVGGPGVDTAVYDGPDRIEGVEHKRLDPDLAAWQPATASGFEPTNPPVLALDGDTSDWWNSGSYPAQWLEVDLQQPRAIGSVRVVTMEYPGNSAVLLLGRATQDAPFRLLHAFRGPLADREQITFTPKTPWRNVRYLRLYVPSANGGVGWVAWHELAVYAPVRKKR